MTDSLLGTVLSAIIAGVFSLIAKRMELNEARRREPGSEVPGPPTKQTDAGTIDKSIIIRHAGIIQLVVNVVGILWRIIFGVTTSYFTYFVVTMISASAAFCWSGLSVKKAGRWKHLFLVSIGVAIATMLINSILLGTLLPFFTPAAVITAFGQAFLFAAIGGFIADKLDD